MWPVMGFQTEHSPWGTTPVWCCLSERLSSLHCWLLWCCLWYAATAALRMGAGQWRPVFAAIRCDSEISALLITVLHCAMLRDWLCAFAYNLQLVCLLLHAYLVH